MKRKKNQLCVIDSMQLENDSSPPSADTKLHQCTGHNGVKGLVSIIET
jgi:hypothetical protein